jgi:AcrR family transcriptional regulator
LTRRPLPPHILELGIAPVRLEQIVRATIRSLARAGYAGLTVKRVAAEASVSPGILHAGGFAR